MRLEDAFDHVPPLVRLPVAIPWGRTVPLGRHDRRQAERLGRRTGGIPLVHAVHEQVLYRAVPGPAAEPPADGDPLAATLRQDPPRGSRAAHPRQGVGERVVVDRGGLRRGRVNGCATLMNRSSVMSYLGVHIRQLSRKT